MIANALARRNGGGGSVAPVWVNGGVVTTFGGTSWNIPEGAAVLSDGNIVVADADNNLIKIVTPAGAVTTLAGSGAPASTDGTGTGASFSNPRNPCVLSGNVIIVADVVNHCIRAVTYPGGVVTTLAGSAGNIGSADGTGASARFNYPFSTCALADGKIAVADRTNQLIRIITYPGGVVTTLAGTVGVTGATDATGTNAKFNGPVSVAKTTDGNIVVADGANNSIRIVTYPGGVVSTLAGSSGAGNAYLDSTGTNARFAAPNGVAVTPTNIIVVGDMLNNCIRLVTNPGGVVTTLAGSTTPGLVDATGTNARFDWPQGVCVLANGNVIVTEYNNNRVRLIT